MEIGKTPELPGEMSGALAGGMGYENAGRRWDRQELGRLESELEWAGEIDINVVRRWAYLYEGSLCGGKMTASGFKSSPRRAITRGPVIPMKEQLEDSDSPVWRRVISLVFSSISSK